MRDNYIFNTIFLTLTMLIGAFSYAMEMPHVDEKMNWSIKEHSNFCEIKGLTRYVIKTNFFDHYYVDELVLQHKENQILGFEIYAPRTLLSGLHNWESITSKYAHLMNEPRKRSGWYQPTAYTPKGITELLEVFYEVGHLSDYVIDKLICYINDIGIHFDDFRKTKKKLTQQEEDLLCLFENTKTKNDISIDLKKEINNKVKAFVKDNTCKNLDHELTNLAVNPESIVRLLNIIRQQEIIIKELKNKQ